MRLLRQAPEASAVRRFVVVCFGFESDRVRRQPWQTAHGIAEGLHGLGRSVTLVTDALHPPDDVAYAVVQVPGLMDGGRPSADLAGLLDGLSPARVFFVTGLRGLARMRRLPWPAPTSLVMASPRLRPREILGLGPGVLWRERDVLALPLLNALIPDARLRRGFAKSGADDLVYLSKATRRRLTAAGLPPGRRLRPQVVPFAPPIEASDPETSDKGPLIAYLGPPLATRGAYLALKAFEVAAARGLRARLLLLLRPDAKAADMRRLLGRIGTSPARARIEVETMMLDHEVLSARLRPVRAFLLPFRAPVAEAPLVVLEAALSNRPVVTLDAIGVGEFAAELGGVVARRPAELPDALMYVLHRPESAPGNVEAWTSWHRAAADLVDPPAGVPRPWRFIGLCGADGSGKTTLLKRIEARYEDEGIAARHVWSRFRNYLSKPLLGLARLTGHNRKEVVDGVATGYHDFAGRPWLAWPFLALQLIDAAIDRRLRYRGHVPVLADRCVLDTVVDLAIDTGLDDLLIDDLAPWLFKRLPRPAFVCVVERHPTRIGRDRPDALHDRNFGRRQGLYRRLAERLDLPVIDNNGAIETALDAILARLVTTDQDVRPT